MPYKRMGTDIDFLIAGEIDRSKQSLRFQSKVFVEVTIILHREELEISAQKENEIQYSSTIG